MSFSNRISRGTFTDSDVIAFYMKYRESKYGKFSREVGDFIAHPRRNRGRTLDLTAYAFSQLAFFQRYQSDKSSPLEHIGRCDWWLKQYFLNKIKEFDPKEFKRDTGFSISEAEIKIRSWFRDKKDPYPTEIWREKPDELYVIANKISGFIHMKSIFDINEVKSELSNIFKEENISSDCMEQFLVGTCIVLSGRVVEIVPGFTAKMSLRVDQTRSVPTGRDGRHAGDPRGWEVIVLADGNLKLSVSTTNQTGDGLVGISLDFLDTQIDTEAYFSRDLIKRDENGFPRLNLNEELSFDTSKAQIVTRTKTE